MLAAASPAADGSVRVPHRPAYHRGSRATATRAPLICRNLAFAGLPLIRKSARSAGMRHLANPLSRAGRWSRPRFNHSSANDRICISAAPDASPMASAACPATASYDDIADIACCAQNRRHPPRCSTASQSQVKRRARPVWRRRTPDPARSGHARIPHWQIDIGSLLPAHTVDFTVASEQPPAGLPLILHVNPPLLPWVLFRLPRALVRGRRIIGYWVWELPTAPPEWQVATSFVHEVWVPSCFRGRCCGAAASWPRAGGAVSDGGQQT